MDEPTRIQVCGLIAGIIASDQEVVTEEAGLLLRIRQRFGLSKGASVPTITNHDEAVATLQAFSDDVQKETLRLLIQAAAIDGEIAPEERSFLDVIAKKLKVGSDELDKRVARELALPRAKPIGPDTSSDDDD